MNRAIKKGVESIFRTLGLEIMPSWALHHDAPLAADLFRSLNIQCVLDVGANNGGFYNFLRHRVQYNGLVISFEPVKKNVDILKLEAMKDPRWIICDYALGDEDTKNIINVMALDVFSSFLEPDESSVNDFNNENVVEHQEIVEVKKLDSIIESLRSKTPLTNIYLKLDTQGYGLKVIAGAVNTLPEILALQSEVSTMKIYQNMPNYIEVLQVLDDKGFDITGFFPCHT